jgi:hypothetical protein
MAGTFITSEPNKVYVEDVQYATSVSESVGNKLGSSMNFILDNFVVYHFGVTGGVYSGLSAYPYTFSNNIENMKSACEITDIEIFTQETGTAGTTEFKLEYQLAAGGAWSNVFSTNCSIAYTTADSTFFKNTDAAPSGVTLPVISKTTYAKNDKLRFVLVTAATNAQNLSIKVNMRPTAA